MKKRAKAKKAPPRKVVQPKPAKRYTDLEVATMRQLSERTRLQVQVMDAAIAVKRDEMEKATAPLAAAIWADEVERDAVQATADMLAALVQAELDVRGEG